MKERGLGTRGGRMTITAVLVCTIVGAMVGATIGFFCGAVVTMAKGTSEDQAQNDREQAAYWAEWQRKHPPKDRGDDEQKPDGNSALSKQPAFAH